MLTSVMAVLILAGVALYLMTPEERTRLGRLAAAAAWDAIGHALKYASSREPFDDFLRARTGQPVVVPAVAALCALTFVLMVFEPGAVDDLDTLVAWGGNIGPRTTGGEWWRLVTATFVHAGPLHLLTTIASLVSVGLALERAVGRLAFGAMFLAAGIVAGVVSLWTTSPVDVTAGASGAVFGIYGLLAASLGWGLVSRPPVPIPMAMVKQIAATAAIFVLYNVSTDHLGTASELAGLVTGFAGGAVVARGVTREKPAAGRAMAVAAATVLIAFASAVPLRGIVDIRPDIARIIAMEERTAAEYDAAVVEFRRRRIAAEDLVQLIDRTIIPDLLTAREQLDAVRGVPEEQAPLVAAAEEYFELREQSWRRRAEGLLASDMAMLRRAEETERAALDALRRMR